MTSNRQNENGGSGKTRGARGLKPHGELDRARVCIEAERSNDWMPAEELHAAALAAVEAGGEVTINLDKIDHLDASALQILLALDVEQKKAGKNLQLARTSPQLLHWFEFAGAMDHFSMIARKCDE